MHFTIPNLSFLMILRSTFILVLISFLSIGGCNENNGGGSGNGDGVDAPAPAPQTMCATASPPCGVTQTANNTIECGPLPGSNCAVDLEEVISHVNASVGSALTNDTVLWIEAWGGAGGQAAMGGTGGAEGGYAITTTSVNGIKAKNGGSSTIYYFYGTPGLDPDERCGAGGGVATIVTTEDLAMNPASNPTQSAPPILLVAGGGGGGAAGNQVGSCLTKSGIFPGNGGEAFATMQADGQGAGVVSTDGSDGIIGDPFAIGGNTNGMGKGGMSFGGSSQNPTSGADGFGGLGGIGGKGPGCVATGANNFSNTPVQLGMTAGSGGNGGGATGSCAAGGGGGGGGYGGGGGGGAGNEFAGIIAGAGGGSFAIQSTQFSRRVPTTKQSTPCVNSVGNGCVRITFAP